MEPWLLYSQFFDLCLLILDFLFDSVGVLGVEALLLGFWLEDIAKTFPLTRRFKNTVSCAGQIRNIYIVVVWRRCLSFLVQNKSINRTTKTALV